MTSEAERVAEVIAESIAQDFSGKTKPGRRGTSYSPKKKDRSHVTQAKKRMKNRKKNLDEYLKY